MRRHLLLALLVLPLTSLLAGCKGNCQQLSEKLCDCAVNSAAKDSCVNRASTEASNIPTDATQEAFCGQMLNSCDCHITNTYEGKLACGLARQRPVSSIP